MMLSLTWSGARVLQRAYIYAYLTIKKEVDVVKLKGITMAREQNAKTVVIFTLKVQ